jgi:Ankyrin repeats (3 copies)
LHAAAAGGQLACCKLLVRQGARLDAVDRIGRTALHLAAQNGHDLVAKYLANRNLALLKVGCVVYVCVLCIYVCVCVSLYAMCVCVCGCVCVCVCVLLLLLLLLLMLIWFLCGHLFLSLTC